MRIVLGTHTHLRGWAEMRYALWTWDTIEDHVEEAENLYLVGNPDRMAFVALGEAEAAVGFAEATIRRDYVEGCETSPVVFLEGVYVRPEVRRSGIARALAAAVADWGRTKGCTEYASNALIDNIGSHRFHAAIGFVETERVVFFKTSV
jgi:aminoglycoside 6'-N-acetyltransferase I